MNINAVAITGNLTRDVELRTTSSGTSVATLGVAVNAREKHGDDWVDRASFFDVTVWGKMAENAANYLGKGSPVAVQGRLRQERWETDDGNRSRVVIVASALQYLPSKKQQDSEEYPEEGPDQAPPDDDIPF